ncbi:hypothetical protein TKK_0013915 [Trichogramma kaykai]
MGHSPTFKEKENSEITEEIDDSTSDENSTGTESCSNSENDDYSDVDTDSEDENTDSYDELLYARAPITVAESMLSILSLAHRFNITGTLMSSILSLIELHCIKPNNCIPSIYKLKKIFENIDKSIRRHAYCSNCESLIEDDFCQICNVQSTDSNYFIEIPIISQLESMFKRPQFLELLQYRFHRVKENEENYEDLYDGSIYKSLPVDFTDNPNNVTFTWNSDGFPLFKSSKCIAGMWFGSKKPAVNLFLSVFEPDLQNLFNGVNFSVPNEDQKVKVRGLIACGTCDLPAKAIFLNLQQYNGKNGCPHCEIETIKIDNKYQTYPYIENIVLRTTDSTNAYAKDAVRLQKPVCGVKGPSYLKIIAYDFMNGTNIDSMHCVYQGVTKKLMCVWFDPDNFRNLYGQKFSTCNIHLLLHLSNDVEKFGPLWALNCFPFENFNGLLKKYVFGSNRPQLQISSSITECVNMQEMKMLRRNYTLSSKVNNYASKLGQRYRGPYRVVKVISPVMYEIRHLKFKQTANVHVSDIKPFVTEDTIEINNKNIDSNSNDQHEKIESIAVELNAQPPDAEVKNTQCKTKPTAARVRQGRQQATQRQAAEATRHSSAPNDSGVANRQARHTSAQDNKKYK